VSVKAGPQKKTGETLGKGKSRCRGKVKRDEYTGGQKAKSITLKVMEKGDATATGGDEAVRLGKAPNVHRKRVR